MSIILNKVEISNMRSHPHFLFEPEREGITSIRGANGAGKSTIVDSIAWALFGTKPSGVSKTSALYRNGAEWGKDKCFVRVSMEVDGDTLLIERRMITKAGAVECDVWQILEENGKVSRKHLAGTAVSQVESYLRRRLRMDEQGFLASILVQQKQVDSLISATAKERAQVIEKLTGISSITNALDQSRAELNTRKRETASFTSNENTIKDIKAEILAARRESDEKSAAMDGKRTVQDGIRSELEELQQAYDSMSSSYNEAETKRGDLVGTKARLASQRDVLEGLMKEKAERKAKLSSLSGDPDEIRQKVLSLRTAHESEKLELSRQEDRRKSFEKVIKESNESIARGEESSITDLAAARDELKSQKSTALAEEKSAKAHDREAASLYGEAKKIQRAVDVLTKGDGTCPTCLQHVSDVSSVVKILEEQRASVLERADEAEQAGEQARELAQKAHERLEGAQAYIDAVKALEEAQKGIQKVEHLITEISDRIRSIGIELEANEKVYNKLRRQQDAKREYDRILTKTQETFLSVEKLEDEERSIEESLKKMRSPSKQSVESERSKLYAAKDRFSSVEIEITRLSGEKNVIEQRLDSLRKDYEREKKSAEKYKDLLSQIEIQANAVSVIERFREDRIQSSVPVIEVYASDLLSRFTDGRFTQLKMDKRFNATVVLRNGTARPVGLLSGGELSAAAMALRIAISMLLNGGQSKNLIVLDEVLVSQDSDRAELMLGTIREVCKGQVILIAHSDIVDSISDKVVEISPKS